jgi:hypothetical protein
MSYCPASDSPVPELKMLLMPEPVRYQNKGAQSVTGMLRHWTVMPDAGMPMSSYALDQEFFSYSSSLPMKKKAKTS